MNVAIIHYWLIADRGGEKVLEALCKLFPNAVIYTHVVDRASLSPSLASRDIRTTFIQKLPLSRKWYKKYIPLMPLALEELDLSAYDLVISSESGPSKNVIVNPEAVHICYCHSPMRYIWDMRHDYMKDKSVLFRMIASPLLHYLREVDVVSSSRVDHFVANSSFVANRIRKFFGRDSTVIYPPVRTAGIQTSFRNNGFYLLVGELVPYKHAELAVRAFTLLGDRLVVIGSGEDLPKLRKEGGPNIEFLGRVDDDVLQQHYAECRALIFPGKEDFGIVPVEAMAAGKPVIAYEGGGTCDTVIDDLTGVMFQEQTVESLKSAIERFKRIECLFDPAAIARHAKHFDEEVFLSRMRTFVNACFDEREKRSRIATAALKAANPIKLVTDPALAISSKFAPNSESRA